MADQLGNTIFIQKGGTTIPAQLTSTVNFTSDMVAITDKDDNLARSFLPGEYGGTMSASFNYDQAAAVALDEHIDDIIAGTSATYLWGGTDSGDETFSATGYVSSVTGNAPQNEAATVDLEIQLSGTITPATVV